MAVVGLGTALVLRSVVVPGAGVWGVGGRYYMESSFEFSVAPKFYEYDFIEGEAD